MQVFAKLIYGCQFSPMGLMGFDDYILYIFGGMETNAVQSRFQLWRLITSAFLFNGLV